MPENYEYVSPYFSTLARTFDIFPSVQTQLLDRFTRCFKDCCLCSLRAYYSQVLEAIGYKPNVAVPEETMGAVLSRIAHSSSQ